MRGQPPSQSSMLCLVSPEGRVRPDYPLREVKTLADAALATLSPLFDEMYAVGGRPSVPPERLLKSMLLMAFYSVRSERLFCEQLDYNLLFRWFLDMDMLEDSFDPSTFTKNRQRLMEHEVAAEFFGAVLGQARDEGLVSREHFSVDGTLIEAWASMKSFRPKGQDGADNNGWGDFKGQRRSNDTHESKTDPEARLLRKGRGREAKLCFSGHALMDNRNGLLVDLRVSQADGYAERNVALEMLQQLGEGRATVGADRAYDTKDFVARCRQADVTPHVAQNENARRRSAIDGRTTRHQGYGISQRIRMRIEQIFGWIKSVGGLRRTRFRGRRKTQHAAYMVGAAYNLLRLGRMHECVS
ncbi:MAG: IS5 family transposase [Proteobacteria bacterium]|nr:IS5 family transposase [Pseudomonadota bacterium]